MKDLALACVQVCKWWRGAAEREDVWRSLIEREGYMQIGWQGSWKERYIWAWRMARCVYFCSRYGEGLAVYRFDLHTFALSIVRCCSYPLSICPISPSALYLYSSALYLPDPRAFQCFFYHVDTSTERKAPFSAPYQHSLCLNDKVYLFAEAEGSTRLDFYSCTQDFSLFHATNLPLAYIYWVIADRERIYICSERELGVYFPVNQQYRALLTKVPELPTISCCSWTVTGDIYVFGGEEFDYLLCSYCPKQNLLKPLGQEFSGQSIYACVRYREKLMIVSVGDSFRLLCVEAGRVRRLLKLEL